MKTIKALAVLSICAALTTPQSIFASDVVPTQAQNVEQAASQLSTYIYSFNVSAIEDGSWHDTRASSGSFYLGSSQTVRLQVVQRPQNPQDNGLINSSYYIMRSDGSIAGMFSGVFGTAPQSRDFNLGPGSYYIMYTTYTKFPIYINGSVSTL